MTHTPSSSWQETANVFPPTTDLPSSVDVAVIGAGLLGASTCYWLAHKGVQVALLERATPAVGGDHSRTGCAIEACLYLLQECNQ